MYWFRPQFIGVKGSGNVVVVLMVHINLHFSTMLVNYQLTSIHHYLTKGDRITFFVLLILFNLRLKIAQKTQMLQVEKTGKVPNATHIFKNFFFFGQDKQVKTYD